MQVLIDSTNTILAYGDLPGGAGPGQQVVTVADNQLSVLQQLGSKTLAADGTITLVQTAAQTAAQAQITNAAQHVQALAALKPTLTSNATTLQNDISLIENLIASIEAGTQPTAAQVLQVLRFVLRVLAVLNS